MALDKALVAPKNLNVDELAKMLASTDEGLWREIFAAGLGAEGAGQRRADDVQHGVPHEAHRCGRHIENFGDDDPGQYQGAGKRPANPLRLERKSLTFISG